MFNRVTEKPRRASAIAAIAFSAILALAACGDDDANGVDTVDGGADGVGADTVDTVDDAADN